MSQIQRDLLLLQILYAQMPNWSFSELEATFLEHPLTNKPLADPPAIAIQKVMAKYVDDLPRRITEEYFKSAKGLDNLISCCELLYSQRVAELETKIEHNKSTFKSQLANL